MIAALRIALAFYSCAGWQRWLNWICGALAAGGILVALATGSILTASRTVAFSRIHTASVAMGLALFGIFLLVLLPAFFGGALLRLASTPSILHLRPHGRRQMLLGATLAITLAAVPFTLFAVVYLLTPLGIKPGGAFGVPPLVVFQYMWGCVALAWVSLFALSFHPVLLRFSFALMGMVPLGVMQLRAVSNGPGSPAYTPGQIGAALFAAGVFAWVMFCLWYLRTSAIRRPSWFGVMTSGQARAEFSWLDPGRWFRRSAHDNAPISQSAALCMYFSVGGSERMYFLMGAAFALVMLVVTKVLIPPANTPQSPFFTYMLAIYIGTLAFMVVRNSRLLWLRAGMIRAVLFREAERHLLRAALATLSVPTVVFGILTLTQRPDLGIGIVLHFAAQLAFATCFLYAGLAVTRGWHVGYVALLLGLSIPGVVALAILRPNQIQSPWAHVIALLLFSALALALRHFARNAWLKMDWRLTGPPLPRGTR